MADSFARYQPSSHLLMLLERAGAAAGRVMASVEVPLAVRRDAAREQARLSAMLDGSPLDAATTERIDREGFADADAATGTGTHTQRQSAGVGGWSAALRSDAFPTTQDVAGREYANLLACARVESEVATTIFDQPLRDLTRLHAVMCEGLVDNERVARLRLTDRAIHDGAQGQMLWLAPAADRLPALMDDLLDWLGTGSAAHPALVVAAIVHERLVEWQPFEAANGRLARSAARVIRRARGLDPLGLSVPERHWWLHTLAYHREVAATMRRRGDLTRWIEKTVHIESVALETLADAVASRLDGVLGVPSHDVRAVLVALGTGATVTVREMSDRLGVSRERARHELVRARHAGLVEDDLTAAAPRFRVLSCV